MLGVRVLVARILTGQRTIRCSRIWLGFCLSCLHRLWSRRDLPEHPVLRFWTACSSLRIKTACHLLNVLFCSNECCGTGKILTLEPGWRSLAFTSKEASPGHLWPRIPQRTTHLWLGGKCFKSLPCSVQTIAFQPALSSETWPKDSLQPSWMTFRQDNTWVLSPQNTDNLSTQRHH